MAELYPFDPTGTNPLNRVVNEQQVVTSVNDVRLFNYIIPKAAPFFSDNFQFVFRRPDNSIRVMVEGVDYYFSNKFISASRACSKPVYGSITFLDRDTSGVIRMTYQSIGGNWTLDDNEIAEIIANQVHNPRVTAWEQITDLPSTFPVIDHQWNLADMVGMKEVTESLDSIREAITGNSGGGIASHVANKNNPHEVTKLQVGLGNVQDFPIATQAQAAGGSNNTTYMTPLRTKQAIDVLTAALIDAHASRTDNPHQTTKLQVGLGNVQDYPMATSAEATAGISNSAYMSPVTTRVVMNIVQTALANHIADKTNPHETNADQVELYNVENFEIATAAEAQAGIVGNKYMTPLRVRQAIDALALAGMSTHENRKDNPHEVTKTQVGLGNVENFAVASPSEALSPTANDRYMTPERVHAVIQAIIGDQLTDHLNAVNPHGITADMIDAYTKTETATLLTTALANYLQSTDTAINSERLGNLTLIELINQLNDDYNNRFTFSSRLVGQAVDPANVSGYRWIHIAELNGIIVGGVDSAPDGHWFVAGGEGFNDEISPLYRIQIGQRHFSDPSVPFELKVHRLTSTQPVEHAFFLGYDNIENKLSLYLRVPNGYLPLTVTSLHPTRETMLMTDLNEAQPADLRAAVLIEDELTRFAQIDAAITAVNVRIDNL